MEYKTGEWFLFSILRQIALKPMIITQKSISFAKKRERNSDGGDKTENVTRKIPLKNENGKEIQLWVNSGRSVHV